MTLAEGRFNPAAERRFNNARADRDYEAAFREAGVGAIDDDPEDVAARVAASAVRAPSWPRSTTGRSAPPTGAAGRGSWGWRGEPTRTPGATASAIRRRGTIRQPWPLGPDRRPWPSSPRLLVALGERLHDLGGDGTAFLSRVRQAHPDDFWA